MPDAIWHWCGYTLAAVAAALVVWALFADRARGRRRCRRCWYDMTGLGEVSVTCPECGRGHARAKHLARTRRRWRRVLLGVVVLMASYGVWTTPRVIARGWYGAVPTTGLIVAAPWLPRAALPSELRSRKMSSSQAGFLKRGLELQRVMGDAPSTLAEELEIRWYGYSRRVFYNRVYMSDCTKRVAIFWWNTCGVLHDLGTLPSTPSEYRFGTGMSLPSLLAAGEFGFATLPSGLSTTVLGALLLSEQPPIWQSHERRMDLGSIAERWALPNGSRVHVSLMSPAKNQTKINVPTRSTSSYVGGRTEYYFTIGAIHSNVVLRYEVDIPGHTTPYTHDIMYEIVPWSGVDTSERRAQWGQAVPRLLNGTPIEPPQNPEPHFQAHVNRLLIPSDR